jgi:undecaprenyl-diphosphatase
MSWKVNSAPIFRTSLIKPVAFLCQLAQSKRQPESLGRKRCGVVHRRECFSLKSEHQARLFNMQPPDSEVIRAVILGVVQGVAEFLPISSAGHLVIVDKLMEETTGHGFGASGLALNVALHVGSLFSILLVFWREILALRHQPRTCGLIVLASVPVAVAGLALEDTIASAFSEPLLPAFALFFTAALLLIGQRLEDGSEQVERMSWLKACVIGLFQAVAIIPGVSRSGSTIAGGMLLGLDRTAAARFSFLLAIPPIAGAGLLKFIELRHNVEPTISFGAMLAGSFTSFVVGYLALNWLLKLISQRQLHRFAAYCIVVGIATIIWRLPVVMSDQKGPATVVELDDVLPDHSH